MRSFWIVLAVRLAAMRLRADRRGAAILFGLALVTAFVASGSMLWLRRDEDAALRGALALATAPRRDLEFTLDSIGAGPLAQFAEVATRGQQLAAALPPTLASLVAGRGDVAESDDFAVPDATRPHSYLRLRIQGDIDQHIRYIAGHAPSGATAAATPGEDPVLEVALSSATARATGAALGQRLNVGGIRVEIVGVFEPIDPLAEYWFEDLLPLTANDRLISMELVEVHGAVVLSPDDYALVARALHTHDIWRFLLDPRRLDPSAAVRLSAELVKLRAAFPFRGSTVGSDTPSLGTGLSEIVAHYRSQRSAADAALALAALGPAAAAMGAIAVVAVVMSRRRRAALLLVRVRGATTRQLLAAELFEALAVAVPAAALGTLAAIALVRPTEPSTAIVVGAGVAAIFGCLMLIAALPVTRGPIGARAVQRAAPARGWSRRLTVEALLVTLAVAGVASLGGRDFGASDAAGVGVPDPGFDAYLVAVPILVAIAGGLLVLRAYPLPVGLLARLAGAGRGLTAVYAMRHAVRGTGSVHTPLLVVLITAAIGTFASTITFTMDRGQMVESWRQVGADYRVESAGPFPLPDGLDVAGVPGISAVATAFRIDGTLSSDSARIMKVTVEALDIGAYLRVNDGYPVDPLFSATLASTSAAGPALGTADRPIPAIVSSAAATRAGLHVGDDFILPSPAGDAKVRVEGVISRYPGMSEEALFVVMPIEGLETTDPTGDFAARVVYARGPAAASAGLRATLDRYGPPATRLAARSDAYEEMHANPLVGSVTTGFQLALVLALVYAALVVATAVGHELALRAREIALLRSMGLTSHQVVGLVVLEQGSMILAALAGGLALGLTMATFTIPSLGLDRFVGPGVAVAVAIDRPSIFAVMLVPGMVALIAVLAATIGARRVDLAIATRSEP